MKYEKLSPGALGCMYTATALGSLVVLLILGALNLFLFFLLTSISGSFCRLWRQWCWF